MKLILETTPETEKAIEGLMRGTRCVSKEEVFRRALALLGMAVEAEREGKRLAIVKDGAIEALVQIETK